MLAQPLPASSTSSRFAHWRRGLVIVSVAIALHLIALEWVGGHIGVPGNQDETDTAANTVVVQLQAPALPAKPAMPAVKKATSLPKPAVKIHQQIAPVAKVQEPIPIPEESTVTPMTDSTALSDSASALPAATADTTASTKDKSMTTDTTQPVAADEARADTPTPEKAPPVPHYKVNLPPPVELEYEVKSVSADMNPIYGHSVINWQDNGKNYSITGRAFIGTTFLGMNKTLFNFKSEGILDDYGIAPVLYNQKKINQSETNTHFNRDERNSISFSSGKLSLIRQDGAQDRGSIAWELAGIGRGDQEKFIPGAQINIFVAGERDGEMWSIKVLGQEQIDTDMGKTSVWHIQRSPQPGTYDKTIDIWLAPKQEWYPVKIRYTEKNGDYMDMTASAIRPLQ